MRGRRVGRVESTVLLAGVSWLAVSLVAAIVMGAREGSVTPISIARSVIWPLGGLLLAALAFRLVGWASGQAPCSGRTRNHEATPVSWALPASAVGRSRSDAGERLVHLASLALAGHRHASLHAGWLGNPGGEWAAADLAVALPGAVALCFAHPTRAERLAVGHGTDWVARYPGGRTHLMASPAARDLKAASAVAKRVPLPVIAVAVLPFGIAADRRLPAVVGFGGQDLLLCREEDLSRILRNLAGRPPADGTLTAMEAAVAWLADNDLGGDRDSVQAWMEQERRERPERHGTGATAGPTVDPRISPCRECGGGMRLSPSLKAEGTRYARCVLDGRHYRDLTLEEERRIIASGEGASLAGRVEIWGTPRDVLWDGSRYTVAGIEGECDHAGILALLAEHPGRLFGPHAP